MIIKTPSRLHMALINMDGSNGRMDGGIGLTLSKPNLVLKGDFSQSNNITVEFKEELNDDTISEYSSKIKETAKIVCDYYNIEEGFDFEVLEHIPNHSGLGSGTQIALATAKIITELKGIEVSAVELSAIVGRGGTSGIGTFAFDNGGFIVDGGHSRSEKPDFLPSSVSPAKPPKLIGRYDFPEDWKIMLAFAKSGNNINGNREVNIFQDTCPVPSHDVEEMAHIIFMNLVPFLLEGDIEEFGKAVNDIQYKGFNKVMIDLQDEKTQNLMRFIKENGAYGVGISSFGPCIYAFFDDKNSDIVDKTKDYLDDEDIVLVSSASNSGFEIIEK